jgi:hypothetical protein
MFQKPAMMLENSNHFLGGLVYYFSKSQQLPECHNNQFEEGFSKDLQS